mmetsp:Transcript_26038/g.60462  ORF Transcript_26038/g.60462 Transcript_26038/m.60462 type:complete len:217 (+) Transcript_26038:1-651(+)
MGMGAVHFEECLVRVCALIAKQWCDEAELPGSTRAADVLSNLVGKHILVYCNKLHQLDFAAELAKDGIPELWELCHGQLKRVFSLYATAEAGTALTVDDFMSIMKDLGLTGSQLTPPMLVDIFTMTQVIVAGSSQNETMSIDEFEEALAACAIYRDPSPYLALNHKIQEFITASLITSLSSIKQRKSYGGAEAKRGAGGAEDAEAPVVKVLEMGTE